MEIFILDTNIFFNMEAGLSLGDKTEDVVVNLTKTILDLKKNKSASFFMPPKAVDEFLSFFPACRQAGEDKNQSFIKDFLSVVNVESPDLTKMSFSASVFYKFVDDARGRSYRGMNIAEEEIEKAASEFSGKKKESKKEFQIAIGVFIKKFRERYRKATRTGFLDSVADLDLIVLAKQKDGFLVSTDEGVLHWGRTLGVKEMPASIFVKRLQSLLLSRQEQGLIRNRQLYQ
ncbi:RNA ligase partner protein [Candidatus Roizmanbacteria bacterium CG_4_10_14_0_2_um_filter_36_35]|uniref:RNA ligase partner protein n=4 Tax=Candidatus Roizmaniibacteriota TaxID=1752723 RepID=A0A2M7BW29_9BACT|nr:MAG: RNA ligase partner protein [Candidatus Roizmanbacteria bacterium CG11_big_fil_rev_8_21_14_0_20_35_14]PIV10751.1 MAG: RNA ligase partner protein [Candidatus Roizmanbacteria bacterium CG03_land_8_20_14_0_80_35_26]PIZ68575.1 MAG: RNA ligase partner protein [Candidatus Roizmanbacteria bacterium CG_4_10_14_0_2_um_filter_36_35]PJC32627.1 MAG: RNA ligase partner protein [Candidatus Roizmanbacteria bacterium CG_4_9_14_0_2_um_filter_36_12]PJC80695.1 MAG: RNA ligase partner protein [Candidatus Ro